jgi:Flp pilus assembly protein TadG
MKHLSIIHRLFRDRAGVAAIEFALLVLPLFVIIFGILEISTMFFVDTALDAAVHKNSRLIKTGQAAETQMSLATFKAAICSDLVYMLNCETKLLVSANVLSDVSTAGGMVPVDTDGNVLIVEGFKTGYGSDYVLVQAFLPWPPVVNLYSLSSRTLADGSYLLGASALFRNEPF